RKRSIMRWRRTIPSARSAPAAVKAIVFSLSRVMYPSRSRRPTISCTVGADSCIARATLAPVIGSPASCSQNRLCRYSSSATVAVRAGTSKMLVHAPRRPSAARARTAGCRAPPPLLRELVERALARVLVVAPATQPGAVTDAPRGDVVEVDLDDQLRTQRDPLQIPAGAPATRIAAAALAGLERRQEADEAALLASGETRAVPHHARRRAGGGILVQAEDQRPHGVRHLAGAPPHDDRVDRAHAPDLRHPGTLAGPVGGRALLGDRPLGPRQPPARVARVGGGLHQLDRRRAKAVAREQPLERRAPLTEGTLEQCPRALGEQVEGHIHRRGLGGQPRDPRGGRMDALAERVEVLAAVGAAHDDLPVEHVVARGEAELGEVAAEGFAAPRLQEGLLP